MSKARSVSKEWEFVSKGTEISLGKARRNKNKTSGEDSTMIDVREVERSF